MKKFDAIVIGGGPIGGHVARKIAEKKYKVAIFEKNKKIGIPVNCAGLVTPRVFKIAEISEENIVQNKIKGANIHPPSDKILKIGGDKIHAYVIDRTKFDREIIRNAKEKGVTVFLENKVLSVQRTTEEIEIKTVNNIEAKSKLVIGADGPFSVVRDRLMFPEPREYLRGIGAEMTGASLDPNCVEIFVGEKFAPGFFAWIIPINDDGTEARVGLCTPKESSYPSKYYFENFMNSKHAKPFLKDSKLVKKTGGVIPLGVLKKAFSENVMLVGDAAAQVKPTSGGGIYPGLVCAEHCSSVAIDALKNNDFSYQYLKKYNKLWTKEIGRELSMGYKFRTVYRHLSDSKFEKYMQKFNNPKIVDVINKYGDIDYPSKLVKPLLKKLPLLLSLVPSMVKDKK